MNRSVAIFDGSVSTPTARVVESRTAQDVRCTSEELVANLWCQYTEEEGVD